MRSVTNYACVLMTARPLSLVTSELQLPRSKLFASVAVCEFLGIDHELGVCVALLLLPG